MRALILGIFAALAVAGSAFANDGLVVPTVPGGSGTVTSVTCGTGMTGGTITTSGTCNVDTTIIAPLASPALTGTPTAPTQSANNNSTRIATTAYADTGLALKANASNPQFGQTQLLSAANNLTAGAGGTQGACFAMTAAINNFSTVATNGDSACLPAATAGMVIFVGNSIASKYMNIYPNGSEQINSLGASVAVKLNGATGVVFVASATGKWQTYVPLTGTAGDFLNFSAQGFPQDSGASLIPISTGLSGAGTGVLTALANAVSGSGSLCLTTSCAMTTPALGTPSAVTLTNGTGLPISTGLSGAGTGVLTALANAVSGSGSLCLTTSCAMTTPTLGVATATSVNGLTVTSSTGTLTIANAKTLTVNNSLTISATDGITMTTPTTSFTAARTDAANSFSGIQTMSGGTILGSTTKINSIIVFSATAPTCSATGGSPTCAMPAASGSAAMWMTLGSASSATSMSITGLTATSHAYVCPILIDTTTASIWGIQTGFSTTGATWTFYTKGTATAASPGASDTVTTACTGV